MRIPVGYAQCNMKYTGVAAPLGAEVTLGLKLPISDPDPEEIGEAVRLAWVENILPGQVNDITLSSILVKKGPNEDGPFAEVTSGALGDSSSPGWTPQVSILVRKNTALGGRRNRGRMFIPGYPENVAAENGGVDTGAQSAINAQFEQLRDDLVTVELLPVVLHGDQILTTPTLITSFSVAPVVATQRRRLRG